MDSDNQNSCVVPIAYTAMALAVAIYLKLELIVGVIFVSVFTTTYVVLMVVNLTD